MLIVPEAHRQHTERRTRMRCACSCRTGRPRHPWRIAPPGREGGKAANVPAPASTHPVRDRIAGIASLAAKGGPAPCVDGSPLARVAWACCETGRCCHVSGLLTRRTCAAGPNAFRGTDPGQEHAFEDALAKLGSSVSRYRPAVRITLRSPFPTSFGGGGPALSRLADRLPVPLTGGHDRPDDKRRLVGSATAAILVVRCASNCTSHGRRVPCRCA